MMIGNRKEEERARTVLLHIIRKSPTPSVSRLTAILTWRKPKSVHGFKPGLPSQNAIALPLVPPPLPRLIPPYCQSFSRHDGDFGRLGDVRHRQPLPLRRPLHRARPQKKVLATILRRKRRRQRRQRRSTAAATSAPHDPPSAAWIGASATSAWAASGKSRFWCCCKGFYDLY